MDGILLIDKPTGPSSAEIVRRVKPYVRPCRVGHLGTLDPFASGLLPIVIGEATKLAPFLEDADKEYEGVIQLGVETDTLDSHGEVTARAPVPSVDSAALARVATTFAGEIAQTVPVFSAVKRDGQPLYKLARKGIAVAPPTRKVTIHSLRLEWVEDSKVRFVLVCSKGTYVRALARDIGRELGSVAFLAKLRRIRTAGFSIQESFSLDEALARLEEARGHLARHGFDLLVSMRRALAGLEEICVGSATASRVLKGDASALGLAPAKGNAAPVLAKVVFAGRLIALAQLGENSSKLLRVFRTVAA
jgi:tRNA pseudouridine55 synthase